jgi:hypothetical protein
MSPRSLPIKSSPATLRAEFEPVLISPYGLHRNAIECRQGWDREKGSDEKLAGMIYLADRWLRHCEPSRRINYTIPNSFSLKRFAERWHAARMGGNVYGHMLHGCLLMACHRRGILMERCKDDPRTAPDRAHLGICSWPS